MRIRPERVAAAVASVRLNTLSFVNMALTWLFTVTSAMDKAEAMSLFGLPSANNRSTSSSRGVRSSTDWRPASFVATLGGMKYFPA